MKSWLAWVVSLSCASAALAEPPGAPEAAAHRGATRLVEKLLVAPLKRADSRRSRFSREGPPPLERRVRVLDAELLTDVRGKRFVRFAIDERYPKDEDESEVWQKDAVLGCAYPEDERVFVRSGEGYVPAAALLGKDAEPEPSACRAA